MPVLHLPTGNETKTVECSGDGQAEKEDEAEEEVEAEEEAEVQWDEDFTFEQHASGNILVLP